MTSLPISPSPAVGRLSYARARLLLGISGVGTAVLLASVLLLFDLPSRGLSVDPSQPILQALGSLALAVVPVITAFLLFDLIGGAWLVRRRSWVSAWLARWARGALLQLAVWLAVATTMMMVARQTAPYDVPAVLLVFVVWQLLLAAWRGRFAGLVASLPIVATPERIRTAAQRAGLDPSRVQVIDATDEGYVGGWSGITAATLLVPARWAHLPDAALHASLARRRLIGERGAHTRGVIGAMLWNTLGLGVVMFTLTPAATATTAAGIASIAAGMTLWAFLSVLVLPTLSRRAVFAADRDAAEAVGATAMRDAIEWLDKWQDDEPKRSRGIETIFHPVPQRSARITRLVNRTAAAPSGLGALTVGHHLARHVLWLSWASLTPISRAVHCNVGRPELWVMLPGD